MNKKVITYGLVGAMLVAPLMPAYVVAQNVEELEVGTVVSQEADELEIESTTEQEVKSLSLEEAVEYALANSKDMAIQNIELQKAEVSYDQNIKAVKQGEKALDINIPGPRTYEVTADSNVNRALLNNGASRRSVELAYQVAKWNKEIKQNQIKYNVEKAYFDLLQMEKELAIAAFTRPSS